jgi:LmbE family N-acetylglucosaminyl deacetylase
MTQSMEAEGDDRREAIPDDKLEPGAHDRVLVLAPHPDDESIACGGLLQVAQGAGAAVRVVVLTDGDNNPWPQRWVEKRWTIGARERARWGARRRDEAREAMRLLNIAEGDGCFLGLPDLGLTDLLMRSDTQVVESLRAQIELFAPTLLVLPALSDRHPDHSATHILSRLALALCSGATPRLLTFAVHGAKPTEGGLAVCLSQAQRDIKQAAILAHASQMRLSQRRFLRYASLRESYQAVARMQGDDRQQPLHASVDQDAVLQVRVDLQRWKAGIRGQMLFCAIECETGASLRWILRPDSPGGQIELHASSAGTQSTQASVHRSVDELSFAIPLAGLGALRQGYVKLARAQPGWRVFDRFGWQTIVS